MSTKGIVNALDSSGQKDIKEDIQHDFIEINDLCKRSMDILVEEINGYQKMIREIVDLCAWQSQN